MVHVILEGAFSHGLQSPSVGPLCPFWLSGQESGGKEQSVGQKLEVPACFVSFPDCRLC